MLLIEGKTIWMIWGLKGKSMAKECESKKGRAEETELTSGGTEN